MNKPAFVFDGRLILDHRRLIDIGFHVEAIGKRLVSNGVYNARQGAFCNVNRQ